VGAFGEKLRRQRELRGLSLEAISTVTKISPRMLHAIEDEHFDQLPGGVFNKGFVRAYARQVGLDEEEAIADYLTALRENQIHAQTILPNFRSPGGKSTEEARESDPHNPDHDHDKDGRRPSGLLADSSVANWPAEDRRIDARRKETRRIKDRDSKDRDSKDRDSKDRDSKDRDSKDRAVHPAERRPIAQDPGAPLSFLNLTPAPASSEVPTHPVERAPERISAENPSRRVPLGKLAASLLLITLALAFWALHRRSQLAAASQPAASSLSVVPVPTLASAATAPSAPPKSVVLPQSRPAAPTHPSATPPDADVDPPPVVKPQAQLASKNLAPTLTLLIRAAQTSWVSIAADGQPVAQETLIAPANTSVHATREIVVKTGNSAGISFLFNGKEIPANGSPGEVRTYTFDASGVRTSAALQAPNPAR
jgi:hypothetical protein